MAAPATLQTFTQEALPDRLGSTTAGRCAFRSGLRGLAQLTTLQHPAAVEDADPAKRLIQARAAGELHVSSS